MDWVVKSIIKRYRKDRKKRPGALRVNNSKKKIRKYFNYGKKGYFVKKYRSLKANAARSKKPRKRPTAKANTAEPSKYKLLF
jgi:hypothetical protein